MTARLVASSAAALALSAALVALSPGAATASPTVEAVADPACTHPALGARTTTPQPRDSAAELSTSRIRRWERQLAHRLRSAPTSARAASDVVKIPVVAHVLAPTQARTPLGPRQVATQISVLNGAYAGRQHKATTGTPFRFRLTDSDVTINRAWYHAEYDTAAERAMKRALHVGDAGVLNVYFVLPNHGTLGWATFPQQYERHSRLDGVVVNVDSVMGGSLDGYNRGDTAVHETGHWLGLYHTFQGACTAANDHVTDTPAEQSPQFACDRRADTCTAAGKDPIHNFMDYSYDTCMRTFTRGQSERMVLHWLAYRS